MFHVITCSNCGRHRRISDKKLQYTINALKAGWNSCGRALYCQTCVETWGERNATALAGERNTFAVIMGQFLREKEAQHGEE